MQIRLMGACLTAALLMGCGGESTVPVEDTPRVTIPPPPPASSGAAASGRPASSATAEQPATADGGAVKDGGKPAEAGVGVRSQRITGSGYLPTVVRAIPLTQERLEFIKVKHALDLYKAGHEGSGPKTHDEFMKEIIKANSVRLPKLPAGQQYEYNPETEELTVIEISNK